MPFLAIYNVYSSILCGVGDVLFSGRIGIAMLVVRIILFYALNGVYGNMVIAWAEAYTCCFMLALYILRTLQKRKA